MFKYKLLKRIRAFVTAFILLVCNCIVSAVTLADVALDSENRTREELEIPKAAWCCYYVGYCINNSDVRQYIGQKIPWANSANSITLMQWLCAKYDVGVYYSFSSTHTERLKGYPELIPEIVETDIESFVPRAGDIIVFDWDGRESPGQIFSHAGIVVSFDGTSLVYIDGNSSGLGETTVLRHTFRKTNSTIVGYLRIDDMVYTSDTEEEPEISEPYEFVIPDEGWSDWTTENYFDTGDLQIQKKTQYGYYHYVLTWSGEVKGAYPVNAVTMGSQKGLDLPDSEKYHEIWLDEPILPLPTDYVTYTVNGENVSFGKYDNTCCVLYGNERISSINNLYYLGERTVYSYKKSHLHRYTSEYEVEHPHKKYSLCGCGDKVYTGQNFFDENCELCNPKHKHNYTLKGYLTEHPHTEYYECSECSSKIIGDRYMFDSGCMHCAASLGNGTTALYYDTGTASFALEAELFTNGKLATVTLSVPEKEGCIFKGWTYVQGGDVPVYFGGETIALDKFGVLYPVWRERTATDDLIILTIGSHEAMVFGKKIYNDVCPVIVKGSTMLPVRFVAESLGAEVIWDDVNKWVVVRKDGVQIILTPGTNMAVVNGEVLYYESPVFSENGRTYAPVRLISENLGAKVKWVDETKQVIISK